jgi:hypothetical protein
MRDCRDEEQKKVRYMWRGVTSDASPGDHTTHPIGGGGGKLAVELEGKKIIRREDGR